MRFTVAGPVAREAFMRAYSAAASTATVPVLQCIRVDSGRDYVRLIGGNGERTAVLRVPAEVRQQGSSLVIPPRLVPILRTCDRDEDVEFDAVGGTLEVKSGSASWRVDLPRELYPDPVLIRPEGTVDASVLREALTRARTGRGKVSGPLSAVTFRAGSLIAASGSRVVRVPCGSPIEGSISESAAADLVTRIQSSGVESLGYGANDLGMTFAFSAMELLTVRRAPAGPDYEASVLEPITRARVVTRIEFERAPMRKALMRLHALSQSAVAIALVEGEVMRLRATIGREQATDEVPLVSASGLRTMSFSVGAMIDVIAATAADPISVSLSEDRPPRLSPLYCATGGFEAVIPQLRSELILHQGRVA